MVIMKLDYNKSPGYDKIPPKVIKELPQVAVQSPLYIMNAIAIEEHIFLKHGKFLKQLWFLNQRRISHR